jgi:hypothetical protein
MLAMWGDTLFLTGEGSLNKNGTEITDSIFSRLLNLFDPFKINPKKLLISSKHCSNKNCQVQTRLN